MSLLVKNNTNKKLDKEEVIRIFIEFLRDNNAYDEFYDFLKHNNLMRYLYRVSPFSFLTQAFTWAYSRSGRKYWLDLNNEWHKRCGCLRY